MTSARSTRLLAILLAVQLLISALFVFGRIVDADEGFYLAAAQRAADGMMPYIDFFYPQAPLMPLVFAAVSDWGMTSLYLLRMLAAIAGLMLTLVVYRIVKEQTEDESAALWGAFLTALSGITLAWHTVYKPFAFVDLALMLSFGLLLRAEQTEKDSGWSAFFSMLFLATAINFRSIFLILIPVYAYFLIRSSLKNHASLTRPLLMMLAGLALPSFPALILFLKSPGSFWFDNLVFHLNREPITPFSALLMHKATVLGKFLALPQTILLLGALVGSAYLIKHKLVEEHLIFRRALLMAVLIGAIYLVPTPVHLQYFQQTMPYLIMIALPVFVFISRTAALSPLKRSVGTLYVVGVLPFIWLFILSPRPRDLKFELSHLKSVVAEVQARSSTSDTLLSEWAGYPALSSRPQLPGTEHVGFYFPLAVDGEEYHRNHLLTNDELATAIGQRRAKLVVVDYKVYPEWQSALDSNYKLASTIGETQLYERNDDAL